MKKKALIIMIIAAFAFAFAGCDGSTESGQTEETTAQAEAETEATTQAAEEETTAAGPEGYQTVSMGNVEMDIPAAWVYDEEDGAEMTHIYRNADESVEFQIQAIETGDEVTDETLGEMTQEIANEWGFGDIGYNDTTIGGSIKGKIIPVDPTQHPDGKFQRIYTLGKDMTIVVISFTQDGEDTTEMNKALDSVHFSL